jgi:hypothetical protein
MQKLPSIPCYPTSITIPNTRNPKLNIYLVFNEKTLTILHRTHILTILQVAIAKILGKPSPPMSLNLHKKDPQHIDNNISYTKFYPDISLPTQNPKIISIRRLHAAWDPDSFIHTYESKKSTHPNNHTYWD